MTKRLGVALVLVPLLAACQSAGPTARNPEGGPSRTTYGWAVPSNTNAISVSHLPPGFPDRISEPPAQLVEIRASDHLAEDPSFGRISFYFEHTFPSYTVKAVGAVGSVAGEDMPRPGIEIVFTFARSQDASGKSTVRAAPPELIRYGSLRHYLHLRENLDGPVRDASVSYGVAIESTRVGGGKPAIRIGEWTEPDGRGGLLYVIAFDAGSG